MDALEMSISKGQDFTFYLKKKKRPLKVLRGNVSFKDHTMEETTVTTAKTKQKKTFKTAQNKTCKLAASKIRYRRR